MNVYPFGQCTWWCADQEPWCLRYGNLMNALDWARLWRLHGGFVQMTPADGAVACFQPGSNGADAGFGHVAVVVAVGSNGAFTVSEMNGPAGPGRTDDRPCQNNNGVSFLREAAPLPPVPEPIEENEMRLFNAGAAGIWALYMGHYFHVTADGLAACEATMVGKIEVIGPQQHQVWLATYPAPPANTGTP